MSTHRAPASVEPWLAPHAPVLPEALGVTSQVTGFTPRRERQESLVQALLQWLASPVTLKTYWETVGKQFRESADVLRGLYFHSSVLANCFFRWATPKMENVNHTCPLQQQTSLQLVQPRHRSPAELSADPNDKQMVFGSRLPSLLLCSLPTEAGLLQSRLTETRAVWRKHKVSQSR